MPKQDERPKTSTAFAGLTTHCMPQDKIGFKGLQDGPTWERLLQGVGDGVRRSAPRMPGIDFSTRPWRDACLAGKMEVPAGYTYFGQLIGHDLGHSIPVGQVPYSERPRDVQAGAKSDYAATRYNVIENPLTLETLYGAGPQMLPHLFDPKTYLFRIHRNSAITVAHPGPDPSVRAIYDSRNRDTHILHRLAAVWMKFHNQVARQFHHALAPKLRDTSVQKSMAYAMARAHVLDVWHHLITTDFLPRFVDPDILALPDDALNAFPVLDETSLLHGVMRAFHALPRRKYKFPVSRRLEDLLLRSLDDDEREESGWTLDWTLFFDDAASGTKTGISASFSPDLAPKNGIKISKLDFATAQSARPLMLGSDKIQKIIAQMRPEWQAQLKPDALASAFTARHAAPFGLDLSPTDVERCPLFLILMIEAQLYGSDGRFGPLGSLLLLRTLTQAMSIIRTTRPDPIVPDLPRPDTMLDLISMTTR